MGWFKKFRKAKGVVDVFADLGLFFTSAAPVRRKTKKLRRWLGAADEVSEMLDEVMPAEPECPMCGEVWDEVYCQNCGHSSK